MNMWQESADLPIPILWCLIVEYWRVIECDDTFVIVLFCATKMVTLRTVLSRRKNYLQLGVREKIEATRLVGSEDFFNKIEN